jgi:Flp pilus assembly pilin Flp
MSTRRPSVFRDQLGASLVEYALILSLVAITCIFGLNVLGARAKAQMAQDASSIRAAETAATHAKAK